MPEQLCIPKYIMESRSPTLTELCDYVAAKPVELVEGRRLNLLKKRHKYSANWRELAREFKERVGYRCQVCNLQCLRPEDPKEHLNRSQIAKLTLNAHHIDGDTSNNAPENIFVVCSKHHLDIHRGTGGVPPKGQQNLFALPS